MTSLSINAHVDTERILAFTPFAHRELKDTTDDIVSSGEVYMRSVVPIGRTGSLITAVGSVVNTVAEGHYRGVVGIDSAIAPHAGFVDKGTGVDGPFEMPVTVTRPPNVKGGRYQGHHEGRKVGVMTFQKNGEPVRYRKTVKAEPSTKIKRNKNFSGKTHFAMRQYTRIEVEQLAKTLALFWAAD